LRLPAWLVVAALLVSACSEPQKPTINLYRAIHAGDLDQIKRHLYWGTDVNRPGADGDYPLHVAARTGRVIIARELLEQEADVNARNAAGQTPLQVALAEGKTQLAGVLVEAGAADDLQGLLFLLAQSGVSDRDSLEFLASRGVDVNARNDAGATPLHLAVSNNRLLVAKRLIGLGADVNATDGDGRTPLAIATAEGRADIVALLEPFGARLDAGGR
jgi:ankyrin repeat protein